MTVKDLRRIYEENSVWDAVKEALVKAGKIPSQSLAGTSMDIEKEAVANLRRQVRFMVVPAIYFLDIHGRVVTMLQGEVTAKQVRTALVGSSSGKRSAGRAAKTAGQS
ncbi:MAG: hypothetical protein J7M25_01680 [Deltaproteobacteria bacterium]|nr:hypothetical protein [Deltaproteobacteria bacterium]